MEQDGSASAPATGPLAAALRRVLAPLVHVMLARGITYAQVAEMLKSVFVEVADRQFQIPGRPQTDSRISLLTGVHRKDVRRLRSAPGGEAAHRHAAVSLGAQLVAAWAGSARYTDASGVPLPLPRRSGAGDPSFDSLVAEVSKDIRSRAVLDEWLRLGVVHLDESDRVVLNTAAFVPQRGFEEKLFYLGLNLGDHASAAIHNVLGEDDPFLERSVHYDELSDASVAELARLAERSGMQAALALNRRAMELEKRDAAEAGPKRRITFGIYFYSAAAEPRDDA